MNVAIHSDIVLFARQEQRSTARATINGKSDKRFNGRKGFASGAIIVAGRAVCREGIVSDRWRTAAKYGERHIHYTEELSSEEFCR